MFWAKARRAYAGVTAADDDIQRYFRVANELQRTGYQGLTGRIQDMGHRWVASRTRLGRVLEIGAGAGRHARFFRGAPDDLVVSEYAGYQVQATNDWLEGIRGRYVRCDARRLPFAAGSFETVLSIYSLEHIADLQMVLHEVCRVLVAGGRFLVALPCEGGLAWNLGRELTTRRRFQKQYRINYDKVIAFEHVWDFDGVHAQIIESGLFDVCSRAFFPFRLATVHLNLIACLELCPRRYPGSPS